MKTKIRAKVYSEEQAQQEIMNHPGYSYVRQFLGSTTSILIFTPKAR